MFKIRENCKVGKAFDVTFCKCALPMAFIADTLGP